MTTENYVYGLVLEVFLQQLGKAERRKPFMIKIFDAIRRKHLVPKREDDKEFFNAIEIVNKAMRKAWKDMPEERTVALNNIAWMWLSRHGDKLKPYKFNKKHFEKLSAAGVSGHAMDSAKVLNIIEASFADL